MCLRLLLVIAVLFFGVHQCQTTFGEFDYEGSGDDSDVFPKHKDYEVNDIDIILRKADLKNVENSKFSSIISDITTLPVLIIDEEEKDTELGHLNRFEENNIKNKTIILDETTATRPVKKPTKSSTIITPPVITEFKSVTVAAAIEPDTTTTTTTTTTTATTIQYNFTKDPCHNCSLRPTRTTENPVDETGKASFFKLLFNLNYLFFLLLLIPIFGIALGVFFCKRKKRRKYSDPAIKSKTRRLSTPSWVFSEPDFDDEEVITLQEEKK